MDATSGAPHPDWEPLHASTVGSVLQATAALVPERTALVEATAVVRDRRRWNYAELLADAEAIARALLQRFSPSEHIAVWAPNSADWVRYELGIALAGMTLVTVNPALRGNEVRHVLRQSRAAGVVLARMHRDNDLERTLAEVRPDLPLLREVLWIDELEPLIAQARPLDHVLPTVDPRSPAQLQYTSGTTGTPKGALLTHFGITNNSRLLAERLQVPLGAVWLNSMPMFHTGGCVLSTLGPIHRQATQVILPAFEAGLVLQVIETERITTTGGVPTMLTALLDHPDFPGTDVSSLQSVSSGGAVVPAELVMRIEQSLGVRYATMFGQTEAAPGITMTALSDSAADKATTVGAPLPWNEVRVVDPQTLQPCAAGQVGELIVRSPMLMSGYYDAPKETAAALIEGGWLRTGDLCTLDERGYVRVAGRLKDMIVRGGENVYPAEIETVLRRHPAVAEAVVVGLPDARWGEIVAAAVLLTPNWPAPPTEKDLEQWTRAELASFKVPRAWRFLEDLPLNAGGKVQKFRVREDWLKKA